MLIFELVQDAHGRVLGTRLNGIDLCTDECRIDQSLGAKPVVHLSLAVDLVRFTVAEVDGTVVEADPAMRMIDSPRGEE